MSLQSIRTRLMRRRGSLGFSMAEVITVVGIAGAIAAISIPAVVDQMKKASEATEQTDLTAIAATLESQILTWRGMPSEPVYICFDSGDAIPLTADDDWPAVNVDTLANTCAEGEWTGLFADGSVTTPNETGGRLSEGVTVMGYVSIDGSYCVEAQHEDPRADRYYIASSIGEPRPGTCAEPADGSGAWTRSTTPPCVNGSSIAPDNALCTTVDQATPAAPYDLTVQVVDRVATLSWTAVSGEYYYASISNNSGKTNISLSDGINTCVFPGDTCAGPGSTGAKLAPGTYEATVRGGNDNGWGPPATVKFHVTSGNG